MLLRNIPLPPLFLSTKKHTADSRHLCPTLLCVRNPHAASAGMPLLMRPIRIFSCGYSPQLTQRSRYWYIMMEAPRRISNTPQLDGRLSIVVGNPSLLNVTIVV